MFPKEKKAQFVKTTDNAFTILSSLQRADAPKGVNLAQFQDINISKQDFITLSCIHQKDLKVSQTYQELLSSVSH